MNKICSFIFMFAIARTNQQAPTNQQGSKKHRSTQEIQTYTVRYTYRFYDPHFNYEPYWPGGDWILRKTTTPATVKASTFPTVCGEECTPAYTKIGPVCGLNSQANEYVDYASYCAFLSEQCKTRLLKGTISIVFVHAGKCERNMSVLYPPMDVGNQPVSRMLWKLSSQADYFKTVQADFINYQQSKWAREWARKKKMEKEKKAYEDEIKRIKSQLTG